MDRLKIHDKYFVPYISHADISAAIDKLAARMNNDFRNSDRAPVFLCILNGSIVFTGELMQRLDFPLELSSVRVSSYSGVTSTGVLNTVVGLNSNMEGRTVVIVEDIVDTGKTIRFLHDHVLERGAAEVRVCTLLCKRDVYDGDVPLDYVAIDVENKFLVGFGLDYDQFGRNTEDIYILEDNQ